MTSLLSILWPLFGAWLLFCLLLSWRSLPTMPRAETRPLRKTPFLSVCVPARDEERRIVPLLSSLLDQTHPRYEVLVLDDGSTDGTAARVRSFARRSRRIRLLKGRSLPPGWKGKPWACHQISRMARGGWLLFVDADVWLERDALERTWRAAEAAGADVYSPFPREHAEGWLARLAVPTLVFLLLSFLPMPWALSPRSPLYRYLGVSGQYTLWRRRAYDAAGGHAAVADEIVEDVKMGWAAARRGLRIAYGNASDAVHCRMYGSASEVWEGFSKNIHPFLGAHPVADLAGLTALLLLFVAPFAVAFAGPGPLFIPALFAASAQWAVRLRHVMQFRLSPVSALLHPFGCLAFAVIGANSARWYLGRGHGTWKGRELRIGGRRA
jgi:chlorobactene glucosyltransferase